MTPSGAIRAPRRSASCIMRPSSRHRSIRRSARRRARKSSSSSSAFSSWPWRSRSEPTDMTASIRRSSHSATKSSRELALTWSSSSGCVSATEELDELTQLAHRYFALTLAVAGDRGQRFPVRRVELDRLLLQGAKTVVRKHHRAREVAPTVGGFAAQNGVRSCADTSARRVLHCKT